MIICKNKEIQEYNNQHLPSCCYVVESKTGKKINKLKKGLDGFLPFNSEFETKEQALKKVNELNKKENITEEQIKAMLFCVSFGFNSGTTMLSFWNNYFTERRNKNVK